MTRRSLFRPILSTLSLLLLAGCTSLSLAVVNIPTWFGAFTVTKDVVFDPETGMALDIYQPPKPADGAGHPVIVFFYGGSWREGDKADYRFVAAALASEGFLVILPNYRKSPTHPYPAFMEDAANATRFAHDQASSYGGDPARLFLMGHSAGAHIAALLGIERQWLDAVGMTRQQIAGVVGLSGPYDLTPRADDIRQVFDGAPEHATHLSRLVDQATPPMLLQYGLADEVVGPQNHERLAAALREKDICHRVETYDGLGHADLVSAFSWVYRSRRPVMDDTLAFLRDTGDCPRV